MTATERLRQLLDERGVEWHGTGSVYGDDFDATESVWKDDALDVTLYGVSPEQAVEATLGKEICRNTQTDFDFMCSECGKCVDNGRVLGFNYCPSCGRKIEK